MATSSAQDFLQPALLDRLTDDDRDSRNEAREQRAMSKQRLRAAVLRDLSWLFNATRSTSDFDCEGYPQAQRSVLTFGLPALSGETASTIDVEALALSVRRAILDHEPRILPATLHVEAVTSGLLMDRHNQLSFRISGQLWAQPIPLDLMLRTEIDLETGHVRVDEVAR